MSYKSNKLNSDQVKIDPVYLKLAKYLDDMPAGYPSTESGVELRILQRYFTPEEAELALHVTLIPEEARVIARRAKISYEEAETRLGEMSLKGLIYRINSDHKSTEYMSNQLVIGIWEFHVNDLDPQLIADMDEYVPDLMKEAWKVPQLRTIPVNQSITAQTEICTYEKAEELINKHKNIAVAPCICRREKTMVNKGCDAPEESCMVFGKAAEYYLGNGIGRMIDHQEALEIMSKADDAGLVIQPSNSQKAANICFCCGCCCGVLRNIKRYPKPVELVSSPFHVTTNDDSCDGCSICIDRCPMDAVSLQEFKSTVDLNRCIGCGLCVTTCPTESLQLVRKPEEEQPLVPKTNTHNYINLGRKRGKLTATKMVMMQVKSKVDRLLTKKQY
jgi:Na+-translocating ferredoxin:NAD+ oxidoreductase RNF subunit RnfB